MKHPLKLESVNVQIRVNLFQERTACDIDKSQYGKGCLSFSEFFLTFVVINRQDMKTSDLIIFFFFMALWLVLVVLYLLTVPKVTLLSLFWVVASGIIIFVPLYKKFTKKQ